jgi:hypothetical protein
MPDRYGTGTNLSHFRPFVAGGHDGMATATTGDEGVGGPGVAVRTGAMLLLATVAAAASACGSEQQRASLTAGSGGAAGNRSGGAAGNRSGGAGTSGAGGGHTATAGAAGPATRLETCADLFDEDRIATYDLRIAQRDWDALVVDFYNLRHNQDLDLDIHPYHPIAELRYGNEIVKNAMIRLKGQSSWEEALEAGDDPPKMQFVISFNEIDAKARFHGVRKLELDMPRSDKSYLRQRLALVYLRAMGLPAQCANSGRLIVNGAYYGLYTNLERPDAEFLERVFPGQADGDLWDGGWGLVTNEATVGQPKPRMDAWHAVRSAAALAAIADMDEVLAEWAGEAMIANEDGYWIGRENFFLYDHPTRGWLWIPHDMDATIDWVAGTDPLYPWGAGLSPWTPPWPHYAAVVNDQAWRERYVQALRRAHDVFVATKLPARLDRYAAQVADAAAADPTRPFGVEEHVAAVASLRLALLEREELIRTWLACRAAPAGARDADHDGHPFCADCDDHDANTYPGAREICGDGADQSCDGSDADGCRSSLVAAPDARP